MATNCRHDWYQSESEVTVNLLRKNVAPDAVKAIVTENNMLTVTVNGEQIFNVCIA